MNFKQIEALVFVNQHGTFKRAAEALYFESAGEEYITPESIQYRIKQLEQDLGVTLYRKKQGSTQVRITREGQLFLKEALEVYHRMIEWREMFLEKQGGILSMAATQAVLINRLHGIFDEYHRKNPDVILRAHSSSASSMERLVAEGRIDFAISTRTPADPDLEYVLWMKTDLVLVTPLGHPLAKKNGVTLKEIAQHSLVLLEPEPNSDREMIDFAFRRNGIRPAHIAFETSNSEIILSYVESGMGVSIISETSLVRCVRKVQRVSIGDQVGRSEVGLLIRNGQYLPTRVKNFIRMLDPKFEAWLAKHDAELEKLKEQNKTAKPRTEG